MGSNPHFTADLATFIEEILNGKLHFLCSVTINAKLEMVFHIFFLVYIRAEVDCTFYVNRCSHIALQQTTVFIVLF